MGKHYNTGNRSVHVFFTLLGQFTAGARSMHSQEPSPSQQDEKDGFETQAECEARGRLRQINEAAYFELIANQFKEKIEKEGY